MTQEELQQIENVYNIRISKVDTRFVRYLYKQINWDARLIGIKGARGVGKTTLLLQRIKLARQKADTVFYASLDSIWFQSHSLPEMVEWLYQRGVRHLYLDEVHKYDRWAQVIKNLYDTYSDLYIVYTGSSLLEIDNSRVDLSRRQTLYTLRGLSFREYLEMQNVVQLPVQTLDGLVENHLQLSMDVVREIPVLKYFDAYLRTGYYPFYIEAGDDYLPRLAEVAQLVIEGDLPAVERMSYSSMQKAKQLMMVIAGNVPLVPNISKLSAQLETTRDVCLRLLYALDRAGLLMLLTKEVKNYKHLVGPEKVYLGNTNLMYALGVHIDEGALRETFFMSQVSAVADVVCPQHGDFQVGHRFLFEVGGRSKNFEQIKDIPDSYLAVDGIDMGSRNRLPLWLFGLLY